MPVETQTTYVLPFTAELTAMKAVDSGEDGEWVISGPINGEGEDYDGDILTDQGVWKGLEVYKKLGALVDVGHRWAKTGDMKFIVGTGEPFRGPDGRPWLKITLHKGKELAKSIWEHVQAKLPCGLSMQGLLKGRDPKDRRKIDETEIHLVTIDATPKGFGNFLVPGVPRGSLGAIAKAVCTASECGGSELPWTTEAEYGAQHNALPQILKCLERIEKALEAGSGIVQAGASGGAALRGQELRGVENASFDAQVRCGHCDTKNLLSRKRCRKCGRTMTPSRRVAPIAKALEARGLPASLAEATATEILRRTKTPKEPQ